MNYHRLQEMKINYDYSRTGKKESYTVYYSEHSWKTYYLDSYGKNLGVIEVNDYQNRGITVNKCFLNSDGSLRYSHVFNFNENGNFDGIEEYFDFNTYDGVEKYWNDGNLIHESRTEGQNYRKH